MLPKLGAVTDDGSAPTHLRDANSVGQNVLRQHCAWSITFVSPAAQACPFLLVTFLLGKQKKSNN
ncbi:MAG: hypothetical protein IKP64_06690 [Selenomonadaceae bacterium]|nr:hypothetical protein [Selenomonadaceae bacterium]